MGEFSNSSVLLTALLSLLFGALLALAYRIINVAVVIVTGTASDALCAMRGGARLNVKAYLSLFFRPRRELSRCAAEVINAVLILAFGLLYSVFTYVVCDGVYRIFSLIFTLVAFFIILRLLRGLCAFIGRGVSGVLGISLLPLYCLCVLFLYCIRGLYMLFSGKKMKKMKK